MLWEDQYLSHDIAVALHPTLLQNGVSVWGHPRRTTSILRSAILRSAVGSGRFSDARVP